MEILWCILIGIVAGWLAHRFWSGTWFIMGWGSTLMPVPKSALPRQVPFQALAIVYPLDMGLVTGAAINEMLPEPVVGIPMSAAFGKGTQVTFVTMFAVWNTMLTGSPEQTE